MGRIDGSTADRLSWQAASSKQCAALVGGSGGGRPDFAQVGGTQADKLEEAVALVYQLVAG